MFLFFEELPNLLYMATIVALAPASKKTCPCGKKNDPNMERIRRTFFMKTFLFWLPLKRYRCYECMRNRWTFG